MYDSLILPLLFLLAALEVGVVAFGIGYAGALLAVRPSEWVGAAGMLSLDGVEVSVSQAVILLPWIIFFLLGLTFLLVEALFFPGSHAVECTVIVTGVNNSLDKTILVESLGGVLHGTILLALRSGTGCGCDFSCYFQYSLSF